jgi:hypothetical protein
VGWDSDWDHRGLPSVVVGCDLVPQVLRLCSICDTLGSHRKANAFEKCV